MIPSLARLSLHRAPPPPTGVFETYNDRDPERFPNEEEEERIRLIQRVASGELELTNAPRNLRDDRDAVLAAVAQDGRVSYAVVVSWDGCGQTSKKDCLM